MSSLDLALVGNGTIGVLVQPRGDIVWGCFPRFDGDPAFCSLLRAESEPDGFGFLAVELVDMVRSEQEYVANTPVLVTRLFDRHGGVVEITDAAPRFLHLGRLFCPMMLVRSIRPLAGQPRVRVRVRPAQAAGQRPATAIAGAHHVRYRCGDLVLRLTTDLSLTALLEENPVIVDREYSLVLGPDDPVRESVARVRRRFLENTVRYWQDWSRSLAIPFEWQDAVIRAAITLELNAFEDTGAIIAAMTTSIPEAPGSGRNWDYRFCWLRDAYFVVNALNQLGATRTMERYLGYIAGIIAGSDGGDLRPAYTVSGRDVPEEHVVTSLSGYRGMGPVRFGNAAGQQPQHDVYGAAILAVAHAFFDRRLPARGATLFHRLEPLGARAAARFDQPDAGLWELRGTRRPHTFSAVMCWAGCDRLARIAAHLGLAPHAQRWQREAERIRAAVLERAWSARRGCFVATLDGGEALDASLLRLQELGFVTRDDPRWVQTVARIGSELQRDGFIFRYTEADDFGAPEHAFVACTFWYINALAALGRREEAREMFERVLRCRNAHGLLAEHVDPRNGEAWGNFVQTYSMVGVIGSALRLSSPWEDAF